MGRITVRIDDQLRHAVEAEASEEGVSPSEIIRRALEDHVRHRKPPINARQLAERLGILGSAEGLPADLSTNHDHMEGFGRG